MAIRSLKNGTFSRSLLVGNSYYIPPSFESITTITGTGSSGTITFSGIPSTYKHLQIRFIARGSTDAVSYVRFNSDTGTNYSDHMLYGGGTSASALNDVNNTRMAQLRHSDTSSIVGGGVVDILDYANTSKYKTMRALTGCDFNGSGIVMMTSGNWRSTSAISSITIFVDGGNYSTDSTFALYGIKGA